MNTVLVAFWVYNLALIVDEVFLDYPLPAIIPQSSLRPRRPGVCQSRRLS